MVDKNLLNKTRYGRPGRPISNGMTKKTIRFDIISLFPESFDSYISESILGRAQRAKQISIGIHNIRNFAEGLPAPARTGRQAGPHQQTHLRRQVDDRPFGGGPGMVLKVEPIYRALKSIKKKRKRRIILFSTRGRRFDERAAKRLSGYNQLIFICGRYEGVDERVTKFIDEEISIGDFVLSGGELPALVVTEAISRFIPGVLGKKESLEYKKAGRRSHPAYTRPEIFEARDKNGKIKKLKVPAVLLSGNHAEIEKWRRKHAA